MASALTPRVTTVRCFTAFVAALCLLLTAAVVDAAPARADGTARLEVTVLSENGVDPGWANVAVTAPDSQYYLFWGGAADGGPAIIEELPVGERLLVSVDWGMEPTATAEVTLQAGETRKLEVRLPGLMALRGKVEGVPSHVKQFESWVHALSCPPSTLVECSQPHSSYLWGEPAVSFDFFSSSTLTPEGNYLERPVYLMASVDPYVLYLDKSGKTTVFAEEAAPADPSVFATFEVPPVGTITGTVVNPKGKPVKGVYVHAHAVNHAGTYYDRSDASGRFTIPVPPDTYDMTVARLHRISGVTVRGNRVTDIGRREAPPTGKGTAKLTGVIKDPEGWYTKVGPMFEWSNMLEVREVAFGGYGSGRESIEWATRDKKPSSKTKKISISNLRPGRYTVHLVGTNITKTVTLRAGKTTSFGTLTRPKAYPSATLTVKTPRGRPAVKRYYRVMDSKGRLAFEGHTNSKGKLKLPPLPPGTYRLLTWGDAAEVVLPKLKVKKPKKTKSGKLKVAKRQKITIRLKGKTTKVSGTVKAADGSPMKSVQVFYMLSSAGVEPSFATFTDANGGYTLEVDEGVASLRVWAKESHPGAYPTVRSAKFSVKPGEHRKGVDLVMTR